MLDRLGTLELHQAGTRDRMHGIASSVRDKMQMESRHGQLLKLLWISELNLLKNRPDRRLR
jgi:hypothetical protein